MAAASEKITTVSGGLKGWNNKKRNIEKLYWHIQEV